MSANPYEAPQASLGKPSEIDVDVLAARSTRFVASMVDSFIIFFVTLPIQYLLGSLIDEIPWAMLNVIFVFLTYAIIFGMNGYLMYNDGQSIGKRLFKIQVVDASSEKLLPLFRIFVIRACWLLPLALLLMLVTFVIAQTIWLVVILFDSLPIFGPDRRCMHDYLAGSKVVMYRNWREHTN